MRENGAERVRENGDETDGAWRRDKLLGFVVCRDRKTLLCGFRGYERREMQVK